MRRIFNILSYKYLWYVKYFLYGMVIFWNFNYLIRTDGDLQARLMKYRQLNKEVVPEKSSYQLVIPGDALLFNRSGDTLGYIRHTMLYAVSGPDSAGMTDGIIYFWIWAGSIRNNQLTCEEIIRHESNAYPLGALRKNARVTGLYLNEKKSWLLCSCEVSINMEFLESFDHYLSRNHWFDPEIYITNTNQLAGIALIPRRPVFTEEELPSMLRSGLFISLHAFLLIVIYLAIKMRYKDHVRKKFLVRLGIVAMGLISAWVLNFVI